MKNKKLSSLLEFKDREQVRSLLGMAAQQSSDSAVAEILLNYIKSPKWVLYGFVEGLQLQGLIGLQLLDKKEAEIQHLAVLPEYAETGLADELVEMVVEKHKLKKIVNR